MILLMTVNTFVFQSTPSAWRETPHLLSIGRFCRSISIHSLRMEGDVYLCAAGADRLIISIHSLRMEGDFHDLCKIDQYKIFQSTPSAWRETFWCWHNAQDSDISIHSLRMEGDLTQKYFRNVSRISIHSLRMEGDMALYARINRTGDFNPLPPHGGRPRHALQGRVKLCISIHSLRMEGDVFDTW